MAVAALTVVLCVALVGTILVLLVVAVRRLFRGTFAISTAPGLTRPFRSGPGVGRGGGRPWPSGDRVPRRPRPGFGSGSIALPEPGQERAAG